MVETTIEFLDLRYKVTQYPWLLASFVDLYNHTFTNRTEREDPTRWVSLLSNDLPAPQPIMHLLVAGEKLKSEKTANLFGGIAFEYYQNSCSGLFTYIAIQQQYRRRRIATALTKQAVTILQNDALTKGTLLSAVFAETEDPDKINKTESSISPSDRLLFLRALGAKQIAIPYIQPQLAGGSGRSRHLLLWTFPAQKNLNRSSPAEDVYRFLYEFYQALGVQFPEKDPDFRKMCESIKKGSFLL